MEDKKYLKYFLFLLILASVARIFIAFFLGLGIDEAHYFQYAVHPALSYYDHPPMVGYLIKIFLATGIQNSLIVRLPAVVSGILIMFLIFYIGKTLFTAQSAFWAVVLFNLLPMFSGIGSIMIVPDTILSVLCLLILLLLWKIHKSGKGYLWYYIGIITGISLLTKYTGFLLYLSILLFTISVPDMRNWFRKKELWLGFLISLLIFSPVLIWNYENYWISFGFQLQHGFENKAVFNAKIFLRNIGAQAGAFSPFLFLFLILAFAKTCIGVLIKAKRAFLIFSFVFPCFLLFGIAALFSEVLPHWPALGYLVLLLPAGDIIAGVFSTHKSFGRKTAFVFLFFSMVIGGIMSAVIPLQAITKVLPIPADVDPTNDLVGWKQVSEKIIDIKRNNDKNDFFIFTHKFYLASELSFYLPENVKVYCLSKRIDQYDFWQYKENLREKLKGKNGIFFCDSHFRISPESLYFFEKIKEEKPLKIFCRGKYAKEFYIYRCYTFNTGKTDEELLNSLPFTPRSTKNEIMSWNKASFLKINGFAKRNKTIDMFFFLVGWLGSGYVLVPLIGIIIWLKKKRRFWVYFGIFALIMIIAGCAGHFLKESFHAGRPLLHFNGEYKVNVIGPRLKSGSFPSGHTLTVFGGVFFLTWLIPEFWSVYWILGILSGISRCYVGAHFPIDVIGGIFVAFFAFLITRLITYKIKR